jgi:hypothetical protein
MLESSPTQKVFQNYLAHSRYFLRVHNHTYLIMFSPQDTYKCITFQIYEQSSQFTNKLLHIYIIFWELLVYISTSAHLLSLYPIHVSQRLLYLPLQLQKLHIHLIWQFITCNCNLSPFYSLSILINYFKPFRIIQKTQEITSLYIFKW